MIEIIVEEEKAQLDELVQQIEISKKRPRTLQGNRFSEI